MLEAIGKELKIVRIRNDLKLEEVADKLEFNRETLRRYENNSSGLSVERLEELLNFYNVDKSNFFANVCANMQQNNSINQEE